MGVVRGTAMIAIHTNTPAMIALSPSPTQLKMVHSTTANIVDMKVSQEREKNT